ncbi:hypothetical protein JVU11DRAFT_8302 [Chiua virens]|nr:hypothetical protein JVU11DRAFT_8302 [Chiua virens]
MTHTGEKRYQCPDIITLARTSAPASQVPCNFRTHDPSSLTKHRKKVHGHVPPPNRSRPSKEISEVAAQVDESVARFLRRLQRPAPVPLRTMTGVPLTPRSRDNCTLVAITVSSLDQTEECTPMDVDWCANPGCDFTNADLIGSDDQVGLDVLYDPTLRTEWMVKYEQTYSSFDRTRMAYTSEPETHIRSSSFLDNLNFAKQNSSREGCLCPEWMANVGVESWDHNSSEVL